MENNANTLSEKNVANNSNSIPVVPAQYRIYFFLLVSCFALWGMLNNMNDTLVPAFAKIFMIKAVDSSLVQVAFYGAYAVLAMPEKIFLSCWCFSRSWFLYDRCIWLYPSSFITKL